jgi:hypothetical protein
MGITGVGDSLIASLIYAAGNKLWINWNPPLILAIEATCSHFAKNENIEISFDQLINIINGDVGKKQLNKFKSGEDYIRDEELALQFAVFKGDELYGFQENEKLDIARKIMKYFKESFLSFLLESPSTGFKVSDSLQKLRQKELRSDHDKIVNLLELIFKQITKLQDTLKKNDSSQETLQIVRKQKYKTIHLRSRSNAFCSIISSPEFKREGNLTIEYILDQFGIFYEIIDYDINHLVDLKQCVLDCGSHFPLNIIILTKEVNETDSICTEKFVSKHKHLLSERFIVLSPEGTQKPDILNPCPNYSFETLSPIMWFKILNSFVFSETDTWHLLNDYLFMDVLTRIKHYCVYSNFYKKWEVSLASLISKSKQKMLSFLGEEHNLYTTYPDDIIINANVALEKNLVAFWSELLLIDAIIKKETSKYEYFVSDEWEQLVEDNWEHYIKNHRDNFLSGKSLFETAGNNQRPNEESDIDIILNRHSVVYCPSDPMGGTTPTLANLLFAFEFVVVIRDGFCALQEAACFNRKVHLLTLRNGIGIKVSFQEDGPPYMPMFYNPKKMGIEFIGSAMDPSFMTFHDCTTLFNDETYMNTFKKFYDKWQDKYDDPDSIPDREYQWILKQMRKAIITVGVDYVKRYKLPMISDFSSYINFSEITVEMLSAFIAFESINIALPKINSLRLDEIRQLRHQLKDELEAFWNESKKMAFELRLLINSKPKSSDISNEVRFLVESKVLPYLTDLRKASADQDKIKLKNVISPNGENVIISHSTGASTLQDQLSQGIFEMPEQNFHRYGGNQKSLQACLLTMESHIQNQLKNKKVKIY